MKKAISTIPGILGILVANAHAEAPMMVAQNGFTTTPIFPIGENIDGNFPAEAVSQ